MKTKINSVNLFFNLLSKESQLHRDEIKFMKKQISLMNISPQGFFSSIERREKGGPVTKGKPYLVGEKGPEVFEPNEVKDTRFTPSFEDRQYTTTTGSLKEGNFEISSRAMGDKEIKNKLSKTYADMGMEMEGSGYLPNVGKKAVDTAAGIAGGIKSLNKDGNAFDKVLSSSGLTRDDAAFAINSQIEGTDAHYMQQVANSINQSVDSRKSRTVIQPVVETKVRQVSQPVPIPSPSNNVNVSTVSKANLSTDIAKMIN